MNDISYTAKELIQGVDQKVDRILEKLDQKVDRPEFQGLSRQVQELVLHGSSQAAEALKEVQNVVQRVSVLERDGAVNEQYIPRFLETEKLGRTTDADLRRLENGIARQIKDVLESNAENIAEARDRGLTHVQKIITITTSVFAGMGTLVSLWIGFKTGTFGG